MYLVIKLSLKGTFLPFHENKIPTLMYLIVYDKKAKHKHHKEHQPDDIFLKVKALQVNYKQNY